MSIPGRGDSSFQDLKAGTCLRTSKEACVEMSKEEREQEVRVVAGGQNTECLIGLEILF